MSELDVVASATLDRRQAEMGLYDPDLDFRKLVAETGKGFFSKGFRLVGKENLIGVPFVMVAVTYREGFPRNGSKGDYASIECVVADAELLNARPVKTQILEAQGISSMDDLEVFPNEPVIFNDSGTGVRRTLTAVFNGAGLIDVGTARSKDENPYDKQYQLWADGADEATTGIDHMPGGEKFRYTCLRGLRKSEYENEYGSGTTYYIG